MKRDPKLMDQIQKAVSEWAQTIKDTMEREENKARNRVHDTSEHEIVFWQQRSATFNHLH